MPPTSESAVLDALRPIIDPDFGKSIVDLGFVKNLRIDGGSVAFDIELTTPACPVKEEFQRSARERVSASAHTHMRARVCVCACCVGVSAACVCVCARALGRACVSVGGDVCVGGRAMWVLVCR